MAWLNEERMSEASIALRLSVLSTGYVNAARLRDPTSFAPLTKGAKKAFIDWFFDRVVEDVAIEL